MDVKELFSLKDKVVLVTGGEGLYGRHITKGLVEAGGKVVTASIDLEGGKRLEQEFKSNGFDICAMFVDQTEHKSIVNLRDSIEKEFGGLDVFVNSAVARPMKRYTDDIEKWSASMSVNATGMFDIVREMAGLIEKRGGGSIVNIGSPQGSYAPDFSLYEGTDMDSPPDYHFHKGGMAVLTRYLARKLGNKGIRVNCVSPGGLYSGQPKTFVDRYNKKVSLGRMANGEDIKGIIVFLASRASSYLTGENIFVDGGLYT